MLRRFTGAPEPEPGRDDQIVSSHSLKATLLSWAARYGLSPATRSLLGRHTSSLNETFAVYSRDLMVGPVAELQNVLDAISKGDFSPNLQRSNFFKPQSQDAVAGFGHFDSNVEVGQNVCVDVHSVKSTPAASPADECCEVAEASDGNRVRVDGSTPNLLESDDDSSEPSDDSGCMSSDDSATADPPARVKRFRARIPVEEKWYVHSKSHLVHRYDGDCHNDIRFLVCGKRLNDAYTLCTEASAWNVLCKSCNRR